MANKTKPTYEELVDALRDCVQDLDDASGVVDAGEGETFAYEATLTKARGLLDRVE